MRTREPASISFQKEGISGVDGGSWPRTSGPIDLAREAVQLELRRIGSETEPPNLATETNTDCAVFQARNPQSPVRVRQGRPPKTPRNRGVFGACPALRPLSLRKRRQNGGERGIRTLGTSRYTRFPSVRLKPLGHLSGTLGWRRGRDSNPRWVSPHTPLAGERLQPLGHLSARATECNGFLAEREGFEPSRRVNAWRFSRPLPSTTRPPLRTGERSRRRFGVGCWEALGGETPAADAAGLDQENREAARRSGRFPTSRLDSIHWACQRAMRYDAYFHPKYPVE